MCVQHLMTMFNSAQQWSLATVPPMPVMKQTSLTSIKSYLFLSDTLQKHIILFHGNINTQIDKNGNNKFCLYKSPNRNGEYLAEFSLNNRLVYVNTNFQKRKRKHMDLYLPK